MTLLVEQGPAHYWAGEMDAAERVLHRAASTQPQLLAGMDCLAAHGQVRELEVLATRLMGDTKLPEIEVDKLSKLS